MDEKLYRVRNICARALGGLYVVRSRRIVEPTNLSVLRQTIDGELTLITCYPTHAIGPAPQRLIIVAKLISESPLSSPTLAENIRIGAHLGRLLWKSDAPH